MPVKCLRSLAATMTGRPLLFRPFLSTRNKVYALVNHQFAAGRPAFLPAISVNRRIQTPIQTELRLYNITTAFIARDRL